MTRMRLLVQEMSLGRSCGRFWWRVIHEFLPAKHILHRRHVESRLRIVRFVGRIRRLAFDTCGKGARKVCDYYFFISCVIITGMYALWTLRNKRRHERSGRLLWRFSGRMTQLLIYGSSVTSQNQPPQEGETQDGGHLIWVGSSAMWMERL